MSSKTITTNTKENGKPALLPKLRFPEFRNGPSWTGKPMGEVYSFKSNNSLSRDQLNYEHGSVKNIHYGDIHTKFSTLFDITKEIVPFISPSESQYSFRPEDHCIEADMIFADASEDLEDIGKSIEVFRLNGERVVAGQHTILARPNYEGLVLGFGAYLFKSRHVRTQIQKESQGSKVLGISATRLTKIKLPIPGTKPEQQKIADCLSSVDEVIAAQVRKVDALKTHRKGLMQQLFPRKGETQPRLRFPEFQDAGEWKEEPFGKVLKITSGKGFKALEYSETGIRLLQIENVGYGVTKWNVNTIYLPETYAVEYPELVLRGGDIVLALNRPVTNDQLKIAKIPKHEAIAILYQRVGRIEVINGSLRADFAFQLCRNFIKDFVINKSIGSDQPFISLKDLYAQNVLLPSPVEQQCVADGLSNLDDLITAETLKLETLKTHKRGLMQQLFPSPEEVEA